MTICTASVKKNILEFFISYYKAVINFRSTQKAERKHYKNTFYILLFAYF